MRYKHFFIIAILIAAVVFGACEKDEPSPFAGMENIDKDASYAMGMSFGIDIFYYLSSNNMFVDIDEMLKGMNDIMKNKEPRIDFVEAERLVSRAMDTIYWQNMAAAEREENNFLAENARRPDIFITPSGLQYEILTEGDGPKPSETTSMVRVHFQGSLLNGMVFDSSYSRGVPEDIPLDLFPGWTEGLELMSVGSQYIFYIPSDLGYGPEGIQGLFPPYATLIFVVELLDIL